MATDDPEEKVRLYVRHVRDITPRTIRLIDQLRVAAPSDDEAAAFLAHMEAGRREGPAALLRPVHEAGQLRAGLSLDDAADVVYAVASPETFRALVEERGWTWRRAEAWITDLLRTALLRSDR